MKTEETKNVLAFPTGDRKEAPDAEMGTRLGDLRIALSLTAEDLARGISETPEQIARYESGEDPVPETALVKLAKLFKVPVRFFFEGRGKGAKSRLTKSLRPVDRWFIEFVYPYQATYIALARRIIGSHDAAFDLVQDAYALVLADEKWKSIQQPRAYVMRIIQNLGFNKLKRALSVPMQGLPVHETMPFADGAPDAFETLSAREELMRLVDAIDELPPQCRKILVMRKLEGLPPREIAAKLGIATSTIDTQLARGLVILTKYFADRGAPVVRLQPKTTRKSPD